MNIELKNDSMIILEVLIRHTNKSNLMFFISIYIFNK